MSYKVIGNVEPTSTLIFTIIYCCLPVAATVLGKGVRTIVATRCFWLETKNLCFRFLYRFLPLFVLSIPITAVTMQ